jgi:hypothetical protein
MLEHEHKRLGHAGTQTVLANFRLKFWPLNALSEIKHIIKNCITCFKFKAQPAEQVMADLPKDRVTVSRPFSRVGVDYGGPFETKDSKLRKPRILKSYIAIFVCLVTKAVHLKLVSSLSTADFLLAFKRFVARRGNPNVIYSDNGTNFVGARTQFNELYQFFQKEPLSDSLNDFLSQNKTTFKFIPPRSPHWGGIWEAAVKSTKYHLSRLIGETRFTFEQFYTVLTQIEAILNSRPLSPLSNDPNDLRPLTPGHFLIGSSLTAYPDKDVTDIPTNRLSVYQKMQQIQQSFWKRWSVDYLSQLQSRPKWFQPSSNLKIDTLVLLKEDNTPALKWPLARIVEVIPGPDGKVRVVKVKTLDGIYTRSIAKICPLPYSEPQVSEETLPTP